MKKLKIGIIVDEGEQPYLNYYLYKKSLNSQKYSVEYLIINKTCSNRSLFSRIFKFIKQRGFTNFFNLIFFRIIYKFETIIVSNDKVFKKVFAKHKLDKFKTKNIYVNPIISTKKNIYHYSNKDIKTISTAKIDLLIRGGKGILQGDILKVCPLGVISIHHGDNDIIRGSPPGFWEIFNKNPSTGFTIQRLSNELDGGDVIFKGKIRTSFIYKMNFCKIYIKSSIFLHQLIEKLSDDPNSIRVYPKVPYLHPIYKTPTIIQSTIYLLRTFKIISDKLINRILLRDIRWSVAYQFSKELSNPILNKSIIIKNPPFRFLADPFVISYNGRTVLFVEDYDIRVSRGKISAYEIKDKYKELGVALEEKFHLAYPFILRVEDNLYMIPETSKKNEIRLYKCINFPLSWKLHKVLMKGFSAADTSLFKYKNKWWIFTNKDSSELNDHDSELHIFSSDNLESGKWIPHAKNPVLFDSKNARNGGLIHHSNNIYRVFQKPGFNMYGEAMGIAKICKLNQEEFEEKEIFEISPKLKKDIVGTHTFSYENGVFCYDFSKYESYLK